jgi:hypothetical protein
MSEVATMGEAVAVLDGVDVAAAVRVAEAVGLGEVPLAGVSVPGGPAAKVPDTVAVAEGVFTKPVGIAVGGDAAVVAVATFSVSGASTAGPAAAVEV